MLKVKMKIDDQALFAMVSQKGILDCYPSDILVSSIIENCSFMPQSKRDEFIKDFTENIRISSLYPGLTIKSKKSGEYRDILFVKKPYVRFEMPAGQPESEAFKKAAEETAYISMGVINKMLKHFNEDKTLFKYDLSENTFIQQKYALHEEEYMDIFDNDRAGIIKQYLEGCVPFEICHVSQIAIKRHYKGHNDIKFKEHIRCRYLENELFTLEPFMYFYIDKEMEDFFEKILYSMCTNGIEGRKAAGAGVFSGFTIDRVDVFKEIESKYYMSLSSVIPTEDELDYLCTFSVDERTGELYTKGALYYNKPQIRMIQEGSIYEGPVEGKNLIFRPSGAEHDLCIFGKAFLLPMEA